jgi:hypothetical protein
MVEALSATVGVRVGMAVTCRPAGARSRSSRAMLGSRSPASIREMEGCGSGTAFDVE